jgi:hypothetical protein
MGDNVNGYEKDISIMSIHRHIRSVSIDRSNEREDNAH